MLKNYISNVPFGVLDDKLKDENNLAIGDSCSELCDTFFPVGENCFALGESCLPLGTSCIALDESCLTLGESCLALGESCLALGESLSPVGETCLATGETAAKISFQDTVLFDSRLGFFFNIIGDKFFGVNKCPI